MIDLCSSKEGFKSLISELFADDYSSVESTGTVIVARETVEVIFIPGQGSLPNFVYIGLDPMKWTPGEITYLRTLPKKNGLVVAHPGSHWDFDFVTSLPSNDPWARAAFKGILSPNVDRRFLDPSFMIEMWSLIVVNSNNPPVVLEVGNQGAIVSDFLQKVTPIASYVLDASAPPSWDFWMKLQFICNSTPPWPGANTRVVVMPERSLYRSSRNVKPTSTPTSTVYVSRIDHLVRCNSNVLDITLG